MPHSLHLQRWLPEALYPALIWFSIFPHFGHLFHASSVLFLMSPIIPSNLYFGHSPYGGPEKLLKIIKEQSHQAGIKVGRLQMLPIVLPLFGISSYFLVKEIVSFFWHNSKKITAEESEAAEKILIQEIKKYDEEHSSQEAEDDLNDPSDRIKS